MNEIVEPTAMVRSQAEIMTPNAKRYMTQLCKHFQHRIPVTLDEEFGTIDFPAGTCGLRAEEGRMVLTASAADQAQLLQVQDVVARHLSRFAFREDGLQVAWL